MWQYNHTTELKHHGVKGMKWGVRRYQNADGSLTEAGKKRSVEKFAKKYYLNTKISGNSAGAKLGVSKSKEIESMYNSKQLKSSRDKLWKVEKVEDDYWKNQKLVDKYQQKVAAKVAKEYGLKYEDVLEGYKYEDQDQGDGSSFDLYLKDKGSSIRKYESEVMDARAAYRSECKKVVDSVVNEYGNTPVKEVFGTSITGKRHSRTTTVSDVLTDALETRTDRERWNNR